MAATARAMAPTRYLAINRPNRRAGHATPCASPDRRPIEFIPGVSAQASYFEIKKTQRASRRAGSDISAVGRNGYPDITGADPIMAYPRMTG